ncbi:MAG: CDP-alcohol phosphatidyltransferase family protein [Lachnospiraceae bacterium]|nr:CDP-alcohol phosphatidyltransferase family protein [Lachnospiraceae bacterium]
MANVITGIRIVCAIALIFCPTFETGFYVFYLLGGISDVLDGFVARRLKIESKFGSKLDTIADIVFVIVVLIKILGTVYIPLWLIIWVICIAILKCINIVSGFVRYKHFVSEHTVLNKICGILLFIIPLCIGKFPWQPVMILIILTCAVATVAAIQEGYYIRTGKVIK